ncbi:MAG: adenine deaminase [Nitrososphaeria archaeon]
MSYENVIKAAMGRIPFDLAIYNVQLVNVFTREIYGADIGIVGDKIAYVGPAGLEKLDAIETIDAKGKYAIPGLIDSHLHIESSMVVPTRFAEAVLPRGTTTVAIDPHEIANVLGKDGVRLMLESSKGLPLKVYVMVPTCVPALLGVETAGATFFAKDVEEMLHWERVIGLAEIMDYPGVINLHDRITDIVKTGVRANVVLDGHHIMLRNRELCAYASTGIDANHENFEFNGVLEEVRVGMYAKLRKNLFSQPEFVKQLNSIPDHQNIIFVTDDVLPDELHANGHLDDTVRTAIANGYDPVDAVQAVTIRPARHLRLFNLGAIAPGKIADIILLEDLKKFEIDRVIANGKIVGVKGKYVGQAPQYKVPAWAKKTVKFSKKFTPEDFMIKAPLKEGRVKVRVLDASSLLINLVTEEVEVENGFIKSNGLQTIAVFERHGKSGNRSLGLIKNFIKTGAVASTVSHDSHNLVCVGINPLDLSIAANKLLEIQGGLVAVKDGRIVALVELPVGGIMSEEPVDLLAEKVSNFRKAVKEMGIVDYPTSIIPIMVLALPVAPMARMTDHGIFDVLQQKLLPLFI